MNHQLREVPQRLSRRARSFLQVHAIRVESLPVEEHRVRWLELGIPVEAIDRVADFESQWGGLVLPPAPCYEGGPRVFCGDTPEGSPEGGWWFEAGIQRAAVPYSFMIGPGGEFGIHGFRWVPLQANIEGWVESVALSHHAAVWAEKITKVRGADVDTLSLDGFEQIPEVAGLADTWWRGPDSLVAIYRGEAEHFSGVQHQRAYVYSGLSDWGLHGG